MSHSSSETLLLPALDVPEGGVHWGSVAKLVKVVNDRNNISKHLRYTFKARLNTGECQRVLNTLTVLHTLSLNSSEDVRKQLADSRYMRMLEKTFAFFDHEVMRSAVVQLLMDWNYLFSDEDLGSRSGRALKSLKSKGAQPVRPTIVAAERREEMVTGMPNHRFIRGVDFGLEANFGPSGESSGLPLVSPRTTRGNKIGRIANKIFRRSPSLPNRASPTPSPTPTLPDGPPATTRLPAQVEDMLGQMPSDTKKLMDLVSDIQVLEKQGGDDNDIQNKFAVAQSLASKCKGWADRVQHIISTHVEDVSMDFVGNTPRGETASPADSAMDLDSNVLTKILDANDKVQSALKGWREVEQHMSQKWAEEMANGKRVDGQYISSSRPHSNVRRQAGGSNAIPRSSSSIVDAIDQQLHAAQVMQIMRTEAHADQLDSMSSDVTQTGPSFTLNDTHHGMWVDFSDSSGSQLSRPTPAGHQTFYSPFQSTAGQPLLDTRGSGLSMKSLSPTKELNRKDFRGSCSPETPYHQEVQLPSPSSHGAGVSGSSAVQGVPSLNLQTPFSSGEAPAFVGTPRPAFIAFPSTQMMPLGVGPIASSKSNQRQLRQTKSFPKARSFQKKEQDGDRNPSEEESSDFYSCTSRLTEISNNSSLLPGQYSQFTSRSISSSSGDDGEENTETSVSPRRVPSFSRHQHSRSTLPESELGQKSSLYESSMKGNLSKAEFMKQVKTPAPGDKSSRAPNRRVPPALRVRFTPEHLKDVLERVSKVHPRSRTVHPDVSTARL